MGVPNVAAHHGVPCVVYAHSMMPSAWEDMSLACLEAMASGKLVIGSDIPGMGEIIGDGATGLLFAPGDARDLVAKTLRAVRDPELSARIGRAARAHVEKQHHLHAMVARYETVLLELVERHRRRRSGRDR
jgi:glycosyltransferase involved in cell wall biosynthesis